MRRTGFTLIELLVVIAVIATLAALLIPLIGIARKASTDAKCQARLGEIKAALSLYKDANGMYPESWGTGGGGGGGGAGGTSDAYSAALGQSTSPKLAPDVKEPGWRIVSAALKRQLASVDPGNFRIVSGDPDWKPTGQYLVDPYGSAGSFHVFRYRPARYYPLPTAGGGTGTGSTIAIDSADPPNLDSYQLWSPGWNGKDEYGEKLYVDGATTRKGDDQTNWSGK